MEDVKRLDPASLKALAHPLRMRLLGELRRSGPATASALARRYGETSGATSYHLRQLARHGFVVEDTGRGTARERWWRAAQRSTRFDTSSFLGDPATAEAIDFVLRQQFEQEADAVRRWLAEQGSWPVEWVDAAESSDWATRLTRDELAAMSREVEAVVTRYWTAALDRPVDESTPLTRVYFRAIPQRDEPS